MNLHVSLKVIQHLNIIRLNDSSLTFTMHIELFFFKTSSYLVGKGAQEFSKELKILPFLG